MPKIFLNNNVSIRGIKAETVLAINIIHLVYSSINEHLTITSITDGEHMPKSLHYVGFALDIRKPTSEYDIDYDLRKCLGKEFDVVVEEDHIHIEYQPKTRA